MTRKIRAAADGRDAGGAGPRRGIVHLVGAGPGDPELLTLRALRRIREAEVAVCDHLVSEAILSLLPAKCERIYAGKERANHALAQDEINKLLVALAREGRRVVRLKGGDPYVFGRGGEEAEFLARYGVDFEVVPGVTSASGAAAYAGIPLTHRDYTAAVTFVTGHRRSGRCELDWPALARPGQTLVIYMGLATLAEICEKLAAHGLAATTPVAVIERATTARQRVVTATLADAAARVAAARVAPPALVIVGEVVRLREQLDWFDAARLAGDAWGLPLPS
ncbi:MAG: uroporphyrinogen-III C-methyltransferase [Burkholderiales bacterium]|nr:uroporphyrinogen-III C-methyltransferase [Burkholderiales bacterium]